MQSKPNLLLIIEPFLYLKRIWLCGKNYFEKDSRHPLLFIYFPFFLFSSSLSAEVLSWERERRRRGREKGKSIGLVSDKMIGCTCVRKSPRALVLFSELIDFVSLHYFLQNHDIFFSLSTIPVQMHSCLFRVFPHLYFFFLFLKFFKKVEEVNLIFKYLW